MATAESVVALEGCGFTIRRPIGGGWAFLSLGGTRDDVVTTVFSVGP